MDLKIQPLLAPSLLQRPSVCPDSAGSCCDFELREIERELWPRVPPQRSHFVARLIRQQAQLREDWDIRGEIVPRPKSHSGVSLILPMKAMISSEEAFAGTCRQQQQQLDFESPL